MPNTTKNIFSQTADRFNENLIKACFSHPPPCMEAPGILPCDQDPDTCPLNYCPQTCTHRKTLADQIKSLNK